MNRTKRERQIEQVAIIVAEHLRSVEGYGGATEEELIAAAKATNDGEGWTFDMEHGLGPNSWLRCEGVSLSDEEWETALALVRKWRTYRRQT